MDLKIKDVAELLNVSETTIRRWLTEGKIPAYRLNHQYRFNKMEIEQWMLSCRLSPDSDKEHVLESSQEDEPKRKKMQPFSLYRAIHRGGIINDIEERDKADIIRAVMDKVAQNLSLDAGVISEMLLDREKLMPTGLGHGIAVPHTRDFLLKGPHDVVVVVPLPGGADWGALDGQDVHTLFFLFACDDKRHLHLLAKLAHLSSNEEALEMMRSAPSTKEFLEYIKGWEGKLIAAGV